VSRVRTDNGETTLWNGQLGRAWGDAQLLHQMFRPLEDLHPL